MQQRFTIQGMAAEIAAAAEELGTAALLEKTARHLRTTGYADALAFSLEEYAETFRSAAVKTIREYIHKHLMMQRVFEPDGTPYCATCRLAPCACSIGVR